jgi:hypothetical protein
MSVLPDLFADNADADNEHLPANSVRCIYILFMLNHRLIVVDLTPYLFFILTFN